MARSRNIKPSIMANEELAELDPIQRLMFIYLWMLADREGRVEDRPKRIAAQAFPYDNIEADSVLQLLQESGFIRRYEADGKKIILVLNFNKHQSPHGTEKDSELPDESGTYTRHKRRPNGYATGEFELVDSNGTVIGQDEDNSLTVKKHPDILIPDTRIPEDTADKSARSRGTVLKTFIEQCKTEGVKPIPDDHHSRVFAQDAGIEPDMLAMCWFRFLEDHTTGARSAKRYKDWGQAFGNAVKANWYKFWFMGDDGVQWTSQGRMYKAAYDAKRGE